MPTSVSAARQVRSGGSRVAHLVTKQGRAYSLGLTPESMAMGGFNYTVEEIARPGRRPLTRVGSPQNRTYRFSHQITSARRPVTATVDALTALARASLEVRIIQVSGIEAGIWWRIKDLQVEIVERNANQDPKIARLTWDLVESFDVKPKIGRTPPPGGMFKADLQPIPSAGASGNPANNPANVPGGSTYESQVPDQASHHTVVAGETLYSIAATIWGNGYFWSYLANANKDKLKFDTRMTPPQPGGSQGTTVAQGNRYLEAGLILDIPHLPSGDLVPGSNPDYPG